MAEVEYLHVCDYSFIGQNGKPCVIGIFDRISAPAFPVAHPYMSIAVQLRGTAHEVVPVRIELARPNGDVLLSMDGQLSVSESGGAFINFNLINTTFPDAGRYVVKVSSGARTLVSHSLVLAKVQGQAPPQTPAGSVH